MTSSFDPAAGSPRLHVGEQHPLDAGKLVEEHRAHFRGALADMLGRGAAAQVARRVDLRSIAIVRGVRHGEHDLLAQHAFDLYERLADEVLRTGERRQHLVAEIAREQHPTQVLDHAFHGQAAGKPPAGLREEYLVGLVVLLDAFHDAIEVVSEHGTSWNRVDPLHFPQCTSAALHVKAAAPRSACDVPSIRQMQAQNTRNPCSSGFEFQAEEQGRLRGEA